MRLIATVLSASCRRAVSTRISSTARAGVWPVSAR